MWLVLCNPHDRSALWAGQGMRARGVTPLKFVAPMEIVCARRLEYVAEHGRAPLARAGLEGQELLDSSRIRGALNRAVRVEFPQLRCAAAADRAYVQAEMDAIVLAWLGALDAPLFNPAHPSGWGGVHWHPFVWALKAQRAGFSTPAQRCGYAGLEAPPVPRGHASTHLVLAGQTYPPLPQDIASMAVRLADSAGVGLLGIDLMWMSDGQVQFIAATSMPELRIGGPAFLDALAAALTAS